MNLTCFVFPCWQPRIRVASPKRDWMDEAPESFPYRCLPLDIANSHGWQILSPCGFDVVWNGGMAVEDVVIRVDPGARADELPVPLFGQGTFTFHVQGLFRTPPGWNLWVSGPPNSFKDGAMPLSGIIETDWAPYSFTMNWKLTRPNHAVRFEENEPFAHFFPVERKVIEAVQPSFAPIEENPELKEQFGAWSRSRDQFHERMRTAPPDKPSEKWQKLYYLGQRPDGQCPVADHQSKLRLREFARSELTGSAPSAMLSAKRATPQPVAAPKLDAEPGWQAAKLAWILEIQERQRALSPVANGIFRREGLSGADFLDQHYAPGRPVVLGNVVADWPARSKWSPAYLREKIGRRTIQYQGERTGDADFELNKDQHKRSSTFADFIDLMTSADGNDYYITAYNSTENAAALQCLDDDLGTLDKYLEHEPGRMEAMLWIGPKNTFTPLHHDLTNNLLVQLVGRKRVVLASPSETPRLYNDTHVFSRIGDVTDPNLDLGKFPLVKDVCFHEVILEAGDALFIPIGWWHQVQSLEFSVTGTYTNFKWPNEGWEFHPAPPPA
jgi:hypothetical protein